MEDLIYFIIFAVITLIISVVKANKKKKLPIVNSFSEFEEKQYPVSEELMETDRLKEIRLQKIKEQFDKIKLSKDAAEETYHSHDAYKIDDSSVSTSQDNTKVAFHNRNVYIIKKDKDENPIVENFNIRDAIIYSEILTRKY